MKELNLLHIALIYLVIINVATFFMYGIDKAARTPPAPEHLLERKKRGQSQTRLSFAERKQARPKVKWKTKKSKWRIREATLLGLAVLGGSIGALLGMKVWQHKTQHKKFKYGLPLILLAQIALIYLLLNR